MMGNEINPNTVLEVWYSGKEDDSSKLVLFREMVAQGRVLVHWEQLQPGTYEDILDKEVE
jgi:hypothetical protein